MRTTPERFSHMLAFTSSRKIIIITTFLDASLSGLYKALSTFRLCNETVHDKVSLISSYYHSSNSEPLKGLVTLYAACVASHLWSSKQFQALVSNHGELGGAIIGLMMN